MDLIDIRDNSLEIRYRYLALIGHMARIDGQLHPSELALWQEMTDSFGIPQERHQELYREQQFSQEEIEEIFRELYAQGLHYSFLLDLLAMAQADGMIMESERLMLFRIGDLIGIHHEAFHNLINFAQTASTLDVEQPIDPMFSYVIDMFFQWLRQHEVILYQQTILAIDKKVDHYLKQCLLAAHL